MNKKWLFVVFIAIPGLLVLLSLGVWQTKRLAWKEALLENINYNDDLKKALVWLDQYGDPYTFHIRDNKGTLAIDLGVYGAPETFIVDESGTVRYRHIGVVTEEVWMEKLLPVINLLRGNSA